MPTDREQYEETRRSKYEKLLFQSPQLVQEMIDEITGLRRGSYEDSLGEYNAELARHGLERSISDAYREDWESEQDVYQNFQEQNRLPLAVKLMEASEGNAGGFNFDASYDGNDDRPGRVVLRRGGFLPDYRLPDPYSANVPYEAGLYAYNPSDPPPLGQAAYFKPYEGYYVNQAALLGSVLTTHGNPNSNKHPYYHDLQNPWANTPGTGYNPEDPRMISPEFDFDTSGQASGQRFTDDPLWGRLEQSGEAIHKQAAADRTGGLDRVMALKSAAYGLRNLDNLEREGSRVLSDQQIATQAGLDKQTAMLDEYGDQYSQYEDAMNEFRGAQSSQTFYDRAIDQYVRDSRQLYDQNKNKTLGTPSGIFGTFGGSETRERLNATGTRQNPGSSLAQAISNQMLANRNNALNNLYGPTGQHPTGSSQLVSQRPAGMPLPSAPDVPGFEASFVETETPVMDTTAGDYARKLQNIRRMNQIASNGPIRK